MLFVARHMPITVFTVDMINKFNARGSSYVLERSLTKLSEITQCNSHYAVQGHSRSPILVPVESPCDFLLVINTNLPPILLRFQVRDDYWSTFR